MSEVKAEVDAAIEAAQEPAAEAKEARPWGVCEANGDSCPVHSSIQPRTHWAYYATPDELGSLIDSLNDRGFRESELKDRLVDERETIERRMRRCPVDKLSRTDEVVKAELDEERKEVMRVRKNRLPLGTPLTEIMELTLRDQILELEEKIYFGSLGQIKVKKREVWQNAIEIKSYDKNCEELTWGGESNTCTLADLIAPSRDVSRPGTPDSGASSSKRDSTGSAGRSVSMVKQLAAAILQVGQSVEEKFLKSPLGEDEKERKRRLKMEEKRKKDKEAEEEEANEEEEQVEVLTPFQNWEVKQLLQSFFSVR